MSKMNETEAGRTLLETLAVLVVMAILLIASLVGYNALIHQWRKHQTVKAVSELAVRYKMRPVAQEGPVTIKSIYPEAERASSVEMKTADTEAGRVKLEVFSEPTSFAVVVQHILDDSCESILENGDYDAVVEGKEINATAATEENAFSKEYLQSLSKEDREVLIEKICRGEMDTMGLVYGDHCPRMGASYWYRGRCWNCPSNQTQDKNGQCCYPNEINECGYCQVAPLSGSTYCIQDPTHICPDNWVCDPTTKQCGQCVKDTDCNCHADMAGYICSNGHCCPSGLVWNGSRCACPSGMELCGTECCPESKHCVTNVDDTNKKVCCVNTGEDKSVCTSADCCASGNCTNNHCCPADREYTVGNDKCCVADRIYEKYGAPWCCSVDLADDGSCPDDCEGCYYNKHCYADGETVGDCGKCNEEQNEVQLDTTKKKNCHKCSSATNWRWQIDSTKVGQPISTDANNCGKCKADGSVEESTSGNICQECSGNTTCTNCVGSTAQWRLAWKNPANTKPCGTSCCPTAQNCVTNGTTNTCCTNTGANGTTCGTNNNCCSSGHCTNGYCCEATKTWVASMTGADKCCLSARVYTADSVKKCCPEDLVAGACPSEAKNCSFNGTTYTPDQAVLDCGICDGATGSVIRNTIAAPACKKCDETPGSATQWKWIADPTKAGQYLTNPNPRTTANDCKVCLATGAAGWAVVSGQNKDVPCGTTCCPHNEHCSSGHCCPPNSEWDAASGKCAEHCPTPKPSTLKARCTYLENENCCGGELTCIHNPASSNPKEGLCVGACVPPDTEVGIVLVLDRSGSMGGTFTYTDEETKEKETIKRYNAVDKALAKLKTYKVEGSADDGWLNAAVYEHDAGGKTRLGWGKHTATAIKKAVFDYKNGGNTGFSHAFKDIEAKCNGNQNFVILWLTDGQVNSGTANLKKNLKNRKCKATLYMASANSKDKTTYSADRWTNITSFGDGFISEFNSAVQDELCVPSGARVKTQTLGLRSCSAGYGYYAGKCNKCPDNALSCDWNETKCKANSCPSKNGKKCNVLPANGHCDNSDTQGWVCNTGYYEKNKACLACTPNAASCTGPGSNVKCKAGYYYDNKSCLACPANGTCSNNKISCNAGYYEDKKTCKACIANAASCTSATGNIVCKSGYYKKGSGKNTTCEFCPANANCSSGKIVCNAGYYEKNNSCLACVANAASCTSATGGIKCKSGFYKKNNQCLACPANATCSGGTSGFCCNANFYKSGDACTACPADKPTTNGGTCKTAKSACKKVK